MGALAELDVQDVSLVRGERLVLQGVGFRVPAGGTLVLSGPNGAGKTSLLRAIAGLLEPRAGRIVIRTRQGQAHEASDERGAFAGWIGHQDGVKPQLTAWEQLMFHRRYCGCGGDISEALSQTGLSRARNLPVQYLSAGQRRRLALARLVLCERPLWLLDEPFSVLDRDGKELVRRLILVHCEGGGIVVAATHEALDVPGTALELA